MEGRRFHRLLLETEVIHTPPKGKKADILNRSSRAKNISMGGICITTDGEPLPMNEYYQLKFTLPGYLEPIETAGTVVWHREYENGKLFDNGIQFLDLDEEYKCMIEEYSIGSIMADD